MVNIGKLNYELGLDTKDFVKGTKATAKEMRDVRRVMRETDTAADRHEKKVKELREAYRKGHVSTDRARRALDKYNDELKEGTRRSNAFGQSFGDMKSRFLSVNPVMAGVAATIGVIAAEIKALQVVGREIAAQFPLIDETAKVSRRLGIATEQLIGFRLAAKQMSGVEANTVDMALQRMTRRVAEAAAGTGEAKAAIEELGLSAAQLSGDPARAFKLIADALSRVERASDRVRLAQKLFDSEGVALVTTLEDGSAALDAYIERAKQLGIAFSDVDAREIEAANDALDNMGTHLKGLKTQIAIELAPTVADAFQAIVLILDQIPKRIDKITGAVSSAASMAASLGGNIVGGPLGMVGSAAATSGAVGATAQAAGSGAIGGLMAEARRSREIAARRAEAARSRAAGASVDGEPDVFDDGGMFDDMPDGMARIREAQEQEAAAREKHNEEMAELWAEIEEGERKREEAKRKQLDKEIEDAKKAEEDRVEFNRRLKASRDFDILVQTGTQRARTLELQARGFGPKKEVQQVRIADDQLQQLVEERETLVEMEDEVGRPV